MVPFQPIVTFVKTFNATYINYMILINRYT